ncbi:MAG: sugar phosphate isomerase/epimerase [Deltaproteobacteria bacterium]|nr:sugar phosphate isomerase/epimerase [Deltaproteobacteria bacterium]MBW2362878.1 sugar phosphate isomerase/epimerase [Deltaproteobacteria bacterium]
MDAQTLGPSDLVLSSGALSNPPFADVVAAAVAGGYKGISLWPGAYTPGRRPGVSYRDMRSMLADNGLVLWDVDAVVAWVGPDDPGPPYLEESPEAVLFELAAELSSRYVNVLLHGRGEAPVDAAAAVLSGVCERAAAHGLRAHMEFSRNRVVRAIPAAAEVVRATGRDDTGLLVDAWHVHFGPGSFADLADIPGTLVTGVQLNDAPSEPPVDLAFATRHQRLVPGEGAMDLVGLLRTLGRIGCQAPLTVEVFDADRLERLGCRGFARLLADSVRGLQRRAAE